MVDAMPCDSPFAIKKQLILYGGDPLPDRLLYQSVMGALQYVNVTWPDISFAMNKV